MHINRYKYARLCTIFNFMTELKFQKNSNLISRTPRHMTSDLKKLFSFLSFHLTPKYLIKTPTPTRDVILKKIENNFFSPPGDARELKLRPFDSESKTSSGSSNSLISKKNHPKQFLFILPLIKKLIFDLKCVGCEI